MSERSRALFSRAISAVKLPAGSKGGLHFAPRLSPGGYGYNILGLGGRHNSRTTNSDGLRAWARFDFRSLSV